MRLTLRTLALPLLSSLLIAGLSACGSSNGPSHQTAPGAAPAGREPITRDAATRTAPVVAGRPARVFVFAGWNPDCSAAPAPTLTVTSAPSQGDVSFRPGQSTSIAASASGTCAGRTSIGTGVYYTARPGAAETDRFSVEARLASGETMSRAFEVTIAE